MQVYSDTELHLTFQYPGELKPLDAQAVAELRRQAMFGNDPLVDTGKLNAQACSKVLLAVGTGTAGSGSGRAPAPGAGAGNGPFSGRISLLEIEGSCIPPVALRKSRAMDGVLSALVSEGTTALGMMPLGQAVGYRLEGRHAWFAAAQGQPVETTALQPGGQELIGSLGIAVSGRILTWTVESDELTYFNRLLASRLDLGTGKPEPLFPAPIH